MRLKYPGITRVNLILLTLDFIYIVSNYSNRLNVPICLLTEYILQTTF